jgi:hypothetical protein
MTSQNNSSHSISELEPITKAKTMVEKHRNKLKTKAMQITFFAGESHGRKS